MYPKDPHDVKWFSCLDTADEAKALYGRLALRFHPGRGGEVVVMTAIIAQYTSCLQSMAGRTFVGPEAMPAPIGTMQIVNDPSSRPWTIFCPFAWSRWMSCSSGAISGFGGAPGAIPGG